MGNERYECIVEAAKMSLIAHPYNELLQMQQVIKPKVEGKEDNLVHKTSKRGNARNFWQRPRRGNEKAIRGARSLSKWSYVSKDQCQHSTGQSRPQHQNIDQIDSFEDNLDRGYNFSFAKPWEAQWMENTLNEGVNNESDPEWPALVVQNKSQ